MLLTKLGELEDVALHHLHDELGRVHKHLVRQVSAHVHVIG